MEKIKFVFDRKPLSEDVINQRQDFDKILQAAKATPKANFSKYYYFGVIGLASLAATFGIYKFVQSHHNSADGNNFTLNANEITVFASDMEADENTVQLAFDDRAAHYNFVAMQQMEEQIRIESNISAPKASKNSSASELELEEKEVIPVEVKKVDSSSNTIISTKPAVPVIAGVSQGNIFWEDFKSNTIFVDDNQVVKQFSIQYTSRTGDRSATVVGNQITPEIIKDLEQVGMNQTIFITNIISSSPSNETKRLLSMELNVLFK